MSEGADGVAVFCGSNVGVREDYAALAKTVGRELARRGRPLVYGGGRLGLMGVVADATLEAGGQVIGVIPDFMVRKEHAHEGATELIVVESMHERKAIMAERAGAGLTMPGGVGTFDELFEAITWNQLGLQAKPIGVLSVSGYYEPLRDLLNAAELEGFLPSSTRESIRFGDDAVALLDALLGGSS
ncbi:MAG: TIGR00730 family Rossman fold protein [Phycisphaerae bacterium]|nr:TIGR00730 family Rossman fold protein [Phycisphaerae bacterium]